jgi:hypothetical protein
MTNGNKDAERLAQLEAEVAALKASLAPKPPPEPFKPQPYQRYDPTANMSMPPSALRAMVEAVPDNFMRDVVRDNRAPSRPSGMIPQQPTGGGPANVPSSGRGWSASIPLSPPPSVAQADRLMDAQEQRDRAELIEREAKFGAMQKMAEQTETMRQQTEALAKLAEPKS